MSTTSLQCDRSQHADCDGSKTIMEQDGPNRYVCRCGCHPQHDTKQCPECRGRGYVSYTRPATREKVNREVGA